MKVIIYTLNNISILEGLKVELYPEVTVFHTRS